MKTEKLIQALARRLKIGRALSGVPNGTASEALGRTDATISKWIGNPGAMKVAQFIDLCVVYKLDPAEEWRQASIVAKGAGS